MNPSPPEPQEGNAESLDFEQLSAAPGALVSVLHVPVPGRVVQIATTRTAKGQVKHLRARWLKLRVRTTFKRPGARPESVVRHVVRAT